MFLLKILDAGQVFAKIIRGQVSLHLIQPQLDVFNITIELLLLVGFTQFNPWEKKGSDVNSKTNLFIQYCTYEYWKYVLK